MRLKPMILASIAVAFVFGFGLMRSLTGASQIKSGVNVGGMLLSFRPYHFTGSDKGTSVCPLCQYPNNPAVQVWVNTDDDKNVSAIVTVLDRLVTENRGKKLKAFVVYVNTGREPDAAERKRIEDLAARAKPKNVALLFVSSADLTAARDNEINPSPQVKNTVFVYKARKVAAKFINLAADAAGLARLENAIRLEL